MITVQHSMGHHAHLGLPTERPVIAPARSPPQLEFDDEFGDSDFGDPDFDVN